MQPVFVPRRAALATIVAIFASFLACAPSHALAADITVFAAASMKTALDEIANAWRAETGNTATISYASSSLLAKQIQQGAPADVFISAAINWMDFLEETKLIKAESRRDLVGNSLVLIAHGREAAPVNITPRFDLAGMLGDAKLAMALVDGVPAGVYGKAALVSLGIWDDVVPKVAQADNVRAALALVSVGEASMGIVYATDAVADNNVTIVGTFPANTHDPIVYPAALTAESNKPAAAAFLDYLSGDAAGTAFRRQGFTMLQE